MRFLKKILVIVLCLALCGCGEGSTGKIDMDLTALSDTVAYAYVCAMISTPEEYEGQTVRLSGTFTVYQTSEKTYFACLVTDSTSCCSQSIEFVLDGDYSYPDDYPALGSTITVSGKLSTYYEGTYRYVTLLNATMKT